MANNFFSKLKYLFLPCQENFYRPKFLESRFLYYYAILLIVLKFAVIPFFFYLPKTNLFADITKTSLIELVNQARQEEGKTVLTESQVLDQAAYLKAKDILDNDYFAHTSPTGVTPWYWFEQAGYDYQYAGENLAIGFLESEEVNQAWLDSPSHRKNIMNGDYNEIGIAVLSGNFQGQETTVVVQLFGKQENPVIKTITAAVKDLTAQQENLSSSTVASKKETASSSDAAEIASSSNNTPAKIILSAYNEPAQDSFTSKMALFFNSGYYVLLQKIIFCSLVFIILLLINTVLFDIFVYRAYEIQYKDILLKTIGFCLVLAVLMHFDKGAVIQLIPHNIKIY